MLLVKPLLCLVASVTNVRCVGALDGNLLKTISGSVCVCMPLVMQNYDTYVSLTCITTETKRTNLSVCRLIVVESNKSRNCTFYFATYHCHLVFKCTTRE
jgi:hypothetical protein